MVMQAVASMVLSNEVVVSNLGVECLEVVAAGVLKPHFVNSFTAEKAKPGSTSLQHLLGAIIARMPSETNVAGTPTGGTMPALSAPAMTGTEACSALSSLLSLSSEPLVKEAISTHLPTVPALSAALLPPTEYSQVSFNRPR